MSAALEVRAPTLSVYVRARLSHSGENAGSHHQQPTVDAELTALSIYLRVHTDDDSGDTAR